MKNDLIAAEYAEALFELACESSCLSEVSSSLRTASEVFENCPEYADVLKSAFIEKSEKDKMIEEAFSSLSEEVFSLIKLLASKGRCEIIPEIRREFSSLENFAEGRADAVVISASPLSQVEREKIVSKLSKRYSKIIDATFKVDEELIGGVKVMIGDVVLDGTVKKELLNIKEVIEK